MGRNRWERLYWKIWGQWAEFGIQHRIFLGLQLAIGILALWLCFHLPVPGLSIAVLAVVAAAMSVHGDMKGWQKSIWMILIGALLLIELQAIRKDRREAQAQATEERHKEECAFKAIRDKQDQDFKATASGITATIAGISKTLDSANTTIKQTRPEAYVQFMDFGFTQPPQETWGAPQFGVNFEFNNIGQYPASNVYKFGKFYWEPMGDEGVLSAFQAFQKDWKSNKRGPSFLAREDKRIEPETQSGFTQAQLQQVAEGAARIIVIFRAEYSDKYGNWGTEICRSVNPISDIAHGSGIEDEFQCKDYKGIKFNNPRYAVEQLK